MTSFHLLRGVVVLASLPAGRSAFAFSDLSAGSSLASLQAVANQQFYLISHSYICSLILLAVGWSVSVWWRGCVKKLLPLPGRHRKDCLAVRPLADWVPPPPTPPKRQLRERPHSAESAAASTDPDTSLLDSSFASCVDDALLLSNLKVKGLHEELAGKREEIRRSESADRAGMDLAACHRVTAIRHAEERMLQSSWERPAGRAC